MKATELPPEKVPSARYPCENQACTGQDTWPPEALRWSPGSEDGDSAAWPPGFYCEPCQNEAPQGREENAPTLAEELARRSRVAGERVGDANAIEMQVVGTLSCFPTDWEEWAQLDVRLVDEHGKPETWTWHLILGHDWHNTECLPGDLVSVEGRLCAHGGNEPLLDLRRVRLLRQGITGEQREELLQCKDPLKRWDRAARASRASRRG